MTQDNPTPPPIDPVPPVGAAQPVEYGTPVSNYPGPGGQYDGPPPTPEEKTMGMLCHLLGALTVFIGPLVVWLIKKDQSRFIDDQGKEALNFQIVALIATLACLIGLCIAPILMLIVTIIRITFSIIGAVKANQGIAYRYPVTFRLIK